MKVNEQTHTKTFGVYIATHGIFVDPWYSVLQNSTNIRPVASRCQGSGSKCQMNSRVDHAKRYCLDEMLGLVHVAKSLNLRSMALYTRPAQAVLVVRADLQANETISSREWQNITNMAAYALMRQNLELCSPQLSEA